MMAFIPDDRIKKCSNSIEVDPRKGPVDMEFIKHHLMEGLARSITEKLLEFNKIKIVTYIGGTTTYSSSIEIIVPK